VYVPNIPYAHSMRSHAHLAVGAVIFRGDDAVLLVRRGQPPLEGTWSLLGGKVLPGESITMAVAREVLEETALVVDVGPHITTVTLSGEGYAYEIHELVCTLRPGTLPDDACAGDDARAVRWCLERDFPELGVTDDVRRVIGLARASSRTA
jgi:8-oxo-dGTP diphosphatase